MDRHTTRRSTSIVCSCVCASLRRVVIMQNTLHWLWLAIVIPVDGDIARAHGDAAAWLILAVRRRRVRVYVLVTAALGPEGGRGVVDMLCDARGQRALEDAAVEDLLAVAWDGAGVLRLRPWHELPARG